METALSVHSDRIMQLEKVESLWGKLTAVSKEYAALWANVKDLVPQSKRQNLRVVKFDSPEKAEQSAANMN